MTIRRNSFKLFIKKCGKQFRNFSYHEIDQIKISHYNRNTILIMLIFTGTQNLVRSQIYFSKYHHKVIFIQANTISGFASHDQLGAMNNIRNSAMETVNHDLIYG